MNKRQWLLMFLIGAFICSAQAQNPNVVRNGSFENPKNTWVNTSCNYMSLLAGATDIPHWTVTPDTSNEIVWAFAPTCDGFSAAGGKYFLDLSGFGGDSPNGGVQQTLKNLVPRRQCSFLMAVVGTVPLVTVDGVPLALIPVKQFKRGSTTWTLEAAGFTPQSTTALLVIRNPSPGAQIVFVDKVVVQIEGGSNVIVSGTTEP